LFDGISCGRVALERAGITVDNYFASEIDQYAMKISNKNYPDIVQMGDITNWKSWELPKIDLIMGGSPCQGFSNAGKGLNFEDPRSKLFFVFVDILKYYKPKYFLLENVKMKKEWQDIISSLMGVEPIEINSSLVSAQNRRRLYWSNIPITQPDDKSLFIADVVEEDAQPIILHNLYGGFGESTPRVFTEKSPTIRTASGGGHIPSVVRKEIYWKDVQEHDAENVFYYTDKSFNWINKSDERKEKFKVYDENTEEKMQMVEASHYKLYSNQRCFGIRDRGGIRYISPIECERLQTLPDNYTQGVSNSQRYKAIGNGWTVDVIAHILKQIKT
jgi:DNA-cytosine methyltransferase